MKPNVPSSAPLRDTAPLLEAINQRDLTAVRALIVQGAAMPEQALLRPALDHDLDMIECLLAAGADVNARDGAPLRMAVNRSTARLPRVVRRLLDAGADPVLAMVHAKTFERQRLLVLLDTGEMSLDLLRAARLVAAVDEPLPRLRAFTKAADHHHALRRKKGGP